MTIRNELLQNTFCQKVWGGGGRFYLGADGSGLIAEEDTVDLIEEDMVVVGDNIDTVSLGWSRV